MSKVAQKPQRPEVPEDATCYTSPDGVLFVPGHYIPVPALALRRAICEEGIFSSEEDWERFCYLLRACFAQEMWQVTEQLKATWSLIHAESDHWWHDHSRRGEAEEEFLDGFLRVLRRANFRPLAYQRIAEAEREDFLYMLPLRVDWDRLDGSFLARFYEKHPEWRDSLPDGPQRDRMLVFFRGIGEERETGRFILQKIDLLVGDLLLALAQALTAPIRLVRRWWTGSSEPPATAAEQGPSGAWTDHSSIHGLISKRRVTLRTAGYGLQNLFRKTTIVEPTFQEVVLLYRLLPASDRRARKEDAEKREPLQIRAYRDIPLSDLEVIFPAKRISMRPLDLVKLTVTGVAGLVAVAMKVFTSLLNPAVLLMTLASLAGYGSKVFFQFKISKDRYMLLLTDALYSKHRDNDVGVILYLVDCVVEQDYKEALLAYAFLALAGGATREELDVQCEQFLAERFNVQADFEVGDALAKLERLGLVTVKGDFWEPVPLSAALDQLMRHTCKPPQEKELLP